MKSRLGNILAWFGFSQESMAMGHAHSHGDGEGHGHTHGVIDASIATTDRGIWAIKWSFILLAITAAFQVAVVIISGSVALLADTIHNVADATTAIPLWIAFRLATRKPTETFTYGYGRVEDLAGLTIVAIILFSAIIAGYEAIDRIVHPQPISALGWVALAGLIGFVGNEAVAVFRIRVGREINSVALIADGYHARTDGLTSLAVVIGVVGVWLGFPLADPVIGLLITAAIFVIVWQSAKSVLTRMLDGVEPGLVAEVRHAAEHVTGITKIVDVKARWLGHKLHIDAAVLTGAGASLTDADKLSSALKNELFQHIPALSVANIRVHASEGATSGTAEPDAHGGGHHPAPAPFAFAGKLAVGRVEIIDTPEGERVSVTVERHVHGLEVLVSIARPSGPDERLVLGPVPSGRRYISAAAPAEPHSFHAILQLRAGGESEAISFHMDEPEGHAH